MKFTKMHGIGNDYVYVNGFAATLADPARLARRISDRHFGVGADGLILILPSQKADVRMRMFNADGSEAEMCGNGIRCVAKYAFDHGLSCSNPMRVETARGVLSLELQTQGGKVNQVAVNMGQPVLKLPDIPVDPQAVTLAVPPNQYSFTIEHRPTAQEKARYSLGESLREDVSYATFVSMGNPHAVIFVEDVDRIDLPYLGPLVEHFKAFPNRINAHWVQVKSPQEVIMRTWERGSGITLACGTGACAVCVAAALTGRTDRKILAHLPGGDLSLEWREKDNCVYMTGPAEEVFSGDWPG
ncbi:MAG: diaminopimelate epimerase [Tepidisphaeraceae bacterium]|jgi:diaminopimelate epimerase